MEIIQLVKCNTKFGETIQAELKKSKIFLPKRFSDAILKKGIENVDVQNTLLVFNGRINNEKNTIKLDFIKKSN